MLKTKKVDRSEFIKNKNEKKEVYKWVAFIKPKNSSKGSKIFEFKED
jgi:hypothetical protein